VDLHGLLEIDVVDPGKLGAGSVAGLMLHIPATHALVRHHRVIRIIIIAAPFGTTRP